MARKAEALCLLCGGLHAGDCGSGQTKKPSKPSAQRTSRKSAPSPTPTSTSVERDSDTEDVFGEIPKATPRFKNTPTSATTERDLSYESALRILRPLLSSPSQATVDRELHRYYPQDVDKRVARWKARHVRKQ